MRTSVLNTVLAVAVVVGVACAGPDDLSPITNKFEVTARGANVLPAITGAGVGDTLANATGSLSANTADSTITYSFTVASTAGSGTVDSVGLVLGGGATNINALPFTPLFCNSAAACATTSGTTAKIATGFPALVTALRGYGVQFLVVTTGRPKSGGGAIRGTVYIVP